MHTVLQTPPTTVLLRRGRAVHAKVESRRSSEHATPATRRRARVGQTKAVLGTVVSTTQRWRFKSERRVGRAQHTCLADMLFRVRAGRSGQKPMLVWLSHGRSAAHTLYSLEYLSLSTYICRTARFNDHLVVLRGARHFTFAFPHDAFYRQGHTRRKSSSVAYCTSADRTARPEVSARKPSFFPMNSVLHQLSRQI